MKRHFSMMAAYNRWANVRLYDMAAALPDELYRKPIDIYFKSFHGTLNHILTADRIWMYRLEGKGDHPGKLNAIIHDDVASLRTARLAEDQRIVSFVDNLDDADFEKLWEFKTLNGTPQRKYVREILAHMFNHQTHHRGQAHAALTMLGVSEPAPLDLLIMLNQ
jgi:uncharacterized damage-inducible protein DinB